MRKVTATDAPWLMGARPAADRLAASRAAAPAASAFESPLEADWRSRS